MEGESSSSTSSREIEDTSSADSKESLAGEGGESSATSQ